MTPFGHIRFAAKSDVGKKRKNNEDAFGVFPSCGVFCVADGMGGGDDGEIASSATVEAVRRFCEGHPFPDGMCWRADDWLEGVSNSVSSASAWIYARARERGLKGCGSTFVGICFDPSHPATAMALHAGDSRLYMLRGRGIKQITKDHSAAEMIGVKDEKDVNPLFRGMILRAVGIRREVELERTMLAIKPGDRFVLCSDGLSKMLPDKRIAELARSSNSLSESVDALVAAANDAGGSDNVTAIVVEVGKVPKALPAKAMPDSQARNTDATDTQDQSSTGETPDESETRDTGVTAQMPNLQEQDAEVAIAKGTERRRLPVGAWVSICVIVALLLTTGMLGWLVWRRMKASSAADVARRAEMSATIEAVTRQISEKNIQRVEQEKVLRAEDAKQARKMMEEERRQFQGNVDLPQGL